MACSFDDSIYDEEIDITQINRITISVDEELELDLTVEQAMLLREALNDIFSHLTSSDVTTSVN